MIFRMQHVQAVLLSSGTRQGVSLPLHDMICVIDV